MKMLQVQNIIETLFSLNIFPVPEVTHIRLVLQQLRRPQGVGPVFEYHNTFLAIY